MGDGHAQCFGLLEGKQGLYNVILLLANHKSLLSFSLRGTFIFIASLDLIKNTEYAKCKVCYAFWVQQSHNHIDWHPMEDWYAAERLCFSVPSRCISIWADQ